MVRIMEIDKQEVVRELGVGKIGGSGFYTADHLSCPNCGRGDSKFGIKFIGTGGLTNCWRCGYSKSIFQYLKDIKKEHLISNYHQHDFNRFSFDGISTNDNNYCPDDDLNHIEKELPIGYRPLDNKNYFDERGIYHVYHPFGCTKSALAIELWDYIIFPLWMDEVLVGWLARSTKTKEWHELNGGLRYRNSPDTEFQNIVGGYDYIKTDTVIIVEGVFDYLKIKHLDPDTDVVFVFGHSVSKTQMTYIKKKGVKNVILMFDSDSYQPILKTGYELENNFEIVKVAIIPGDPGELELDEYFDSLTDLVSVEEFRLINIK